MRSALFGPRQPGPGRCRASAASRTRGRPEAAAWLLPALLLLLLVAAAGQADAAWVRPIEGAGNFHSMIDVLHNWHSDGTLDVILLISVANREITFQPREGKIMGQLQVFASLRGVDGQVVERERTIHLRTGDRTEAGSPTLYQIFSVVLPGIRARSGEITCVLEDLNRPRAGLLSSMQNQNARSEAAGLWDAPASRAEARGLALDNPVFLAAAPIESWSLDADLARDLEGSPFFAFLHPNRRYGLEQDHLQVYFEVIPPTTPDPEALSEGVFVQVLAKDLAFALRDTILFADKELRTLRDGGATGVYYDLDVNLLPPGPYQLTCAPLGEGGRSFLVEFDVMWSLTALSRHRDELEGEARTVLLGDKLEEFMAAGQAEREVILEKFWSDHDPDPETPLNEAYLEFRSRIAYVRSHLGGFGRAGATDDRGRVYLLLGRPDEVQVEVMPLNQRDQEDAVAKVFDKYAPDRPGTQAKGAHEEGTQGRNPWDAKGGVPMTYNYQSRRELEAKQRNIGRDMSFELWRYNHTGRQLFPNQYSGQQLGLNFLFVDRNGIGKYYLETTNVRRIAN